MQSGSPLRTQSQEFTRSNSIVRWILVIAAFALVMEGLGAILYQGEVTHPRWEGAHNKWLWDYLDLLIVPAAIAIGATVLNLMQNERARKAEDAQQERELAVENQRAQDEALQAYLDQMSQLLADKERPLSSAQLDDNLSTIARARTLTALTRLNSERKRSVLQFLFESGLIYRYHSHLNESGLIESQHPIVSLSQADLSAASLGAANLHTAYLGEANLRKAHLHATDLREADLSDVDLNEGDLSAANLHGANLSGADLTDANLTSATMPNGQTYEEWLETPEGQQGLKTYKEGRGEDSGLS